MDEITKQAMLKELTHDENVEFEKLVPKVKQIVKIKPDGTPVIICDMTKLNRQEQIFAYLAGKFFAKLVEISPKESAQVKEIAEYLRIENNIVAARLVELRDKRQVEQVGRGEYKISTVSLEKNLDQILKKIGA
jgi:hypothetical protein